MTQYDGKYGTQTIRVQPGQQIVRHDSTNLNFLQSKVLKCSTEIELEVLLNYWLAKQQYARIERIQWQPLPIGGGEDNRNPFHSVLILYFPKPEYAAGILNQIAGMEKDGTINQALINNMTYKEMKSNE